MIKYAVINLNEGLEFKEEENLNLFKILKKEMKDAAVNVYSVSDGIDIYYDEEYFLKRNNLEPTIIIKNNAEPFINADDVLFAGSILIASSSSSSGSLSEEDIENLLNNLSEAMLVFKSVHVYKNY